MEIKKLHEKHGFEYPLDPQIADKFSSYFDSLGIHAEIYPKGPMHHLGRYTVIADLENSNIDGLIYFPVEPGKYDHYAQGSHFMYSVKHETGDERKELMANTKKIKEGIFRKPVDFKWVGGQIADILNQDTALKEPLYDELNITRPKEFDESSRYCNIKRTEDIQIRPYNHVVMICTPFTWWNGDLTQTFPPPHVFRAYDKIAKYIHKYVHY